jgi:hypothetical protein
VTGQIGRDNAPVHFDDALFTADLARLPEIARRALEAARSRHERDGVSASERMSSDETEQPPKQALHIRQTHSLAVACAPPPSRLPPGPRGQALPLQTRLQPEYGTPRAVGQ